MMATEVMQMLGNYLVKVVLRIGMDNCAMRKTVNTETLAL